MPIVQNLSRRQGKSVIELYAVRLAIETGQTLLVATTHPKEKMEKLRSIFPDVKMRLAETGVLVNHK